eukprot:137011_1
MAKILYSIIGTCGYDKSTVLVEAHLQSKQTSTKITNKSVRACRKILKLIAQNQFRRPDGMATLLSGNFAYHYIHGCELDDNDSTAQNLVFVCVTEALPTAVTPSNMREAAFEFLSFLRMQFLQQFRSDLNVLLKPSHKMQYDLQLFATATTMDLLYFPWYGKASFNSLKATCLINCYNEWESVKNAFGMNTKLAIEWLNKQKKKK